MAAKVEVEPHIPPIMIRDISTDENQLDISWENIVLPDSRTGGSTIISY